jgi:hypothetical protein
VLVVTGIYDPMWLYKVVHMLVALHVVQYLRLRAAFNIHVRVGLFSLSDLPISYNSHVSPWSGGVTYGRGGRALIWVTKLHKRMGSEATSFSPLNSMSDTKEVVSSQPQVRILPIISGAE